MIKLLILIAIVMLLGCSSLTESQRDDLLEFHTDDNYLALYLLVNSKTNRLSNPKYTQDILNFQNKIWEENKPEYEILLSKINKPSQLTYLNFKLRFETEYFPLIEKSKRSSEFQILKAQTDNYKRNIQEIWKKNFSKTESIISSLTSLNLTGVTQVPITHPGLKNGRELNGQWIEWGGYDDPNYVLTYLWHEMLHTYFDKSNLSHSIIELISDNELNKQLTGNDYPPARGHRQLNLIKECLMNDWKAYLLAPKKDIQAFLHKQQTIKCGELFKDLNW